MPRWEASPDRHHQARTRPAIAATALLPLSPVPTCRPPQLAAILGVSGLALALPTRLALRSRPVAAIGAAE